MGYRPTIICGDKKIRLGKFYGYVDLDYLKSIKWLIEHKKIEDDTTLIFDYSNTEPTIEFTAEEFREFFDLYEEDIKDFRFDLSYIKYPSNYRFMEHYPELKEIYDNDEPKVIDWG